MFVASADPLDVLVADDQADVLDAIRLLLQPEGIRTRTVQSPSAVLQALDERPYDLLLMDLNYARDTTSGREGLDLLNHVQRGYANLPIVVMTGWGTMEIAVEALRHGVRDFVQKPWDNDHLLHVVRTLAGQYREERSRATRAAREVDDARQIQRGLLPHTLPEVEGWRFGVLFEPASHVGGDVYDIARLPDGRVALCLGDVAGKGVPAALLAASLQTAVRGATARGLSPSALACEVNRVLAASIPGNRFATFFCGVLDPVSGLFVYTNAGHNPPLLARASGGVERLSAGDLVLGVSTDAVYHEHATTLAHGDRLLVYSDGLVEARDASGDEFGETRLGGLLATLAPCDPGTLVADIAAHVQRFAGPDPADDQTAVVVLRET